jgi:GNAT superfamily N-acetyltransferase
MTNSSLAGTATEPCRTLAWDSEFFGISIAAVTGASLTAERADAIDRWATDRRVRCLYFFADPADPETIRLAEQRGYALADVRMTYAAPVREWHAEVSASSLAAIRPATAEDLEALKTIARSAHRNTRFYRDPHFEPARCDALYERWIERSCEGWADRVLVAGPAGDPTGYVTLHRDRGDLRLVAVRQDVRGQGVARLLYEAGIAWLAANGVEQVSSPTQVFNVAAQRLFQRVHLRLSSVSFIYHRWFDIPAQPRATR